MTEKINDRRSVVIFIASMLIFGTVGVLRRYIPLGSALLAFSRGMLGGILGGVPGKWKDTQVINAAEYKM